MDESPKIGDAKPAAPHEGATKTENDKIETVAEGVIAAFVKINRANRKADTAENERNHRREQRRFKVEIIEIILIAVYAAVTVFEWRTFNSERVTMEGEFQASQKSAITQLAEMKRTRELDERAWVAASGTIITSQTGNGDERFTVTFRNTGKTPAVNCQVKIVNVFNTNDIPKQENPHMPEQALQLLPPNDSVSTFIDMKTSELQPGKVFFIYGTSWYDDVFGKHHWSQFCFTIRCDSSPTSFYYFPTAIHNTCDDAETNQTN